MKRTLFLLSFVVCFISTYAQIIDIKYDGTTATVTIPSSITDVTKSVVGADVVLTSTTTTTEYTYHVSGRTMNGSLTINGSYKLTLELGGVNIKSNKGAAIDIECGKRIAVVLCPGTLNTLEDCTGGAQKAAMYFSGHPEFEGSGMLSVTGNSAHAISAKEYLQVKKSVGTINILKAVKDGIHCGKGKVSAWDDEMTLNENELFICNGGIINITNVGGDCIDAGDYGSMYVTGGTMNLDVSANSSCGMKCVNTLMMDGGNINIQVDGQDCEGIIFSNTARINGGSIDIYVPGDGSKGIKGKLDSKTPYTAGGNIFVGEEAGINITVCGYDFEKVGSIGDFSHCVALSVDGCVENNGKISLTAASAESRALTCDGTVSGDISISTQQWYVNPFDYKYDMSAYVIPEELGKAEYKKYEIAVFVGNECRGWCKCGDDDIWHMRIYSNNESTTAESLSFRAYNTESGDVLHFKTTIPFKSDNISGTPLTPIKLYTDYISGDVDSDGKVSIKDLVCQIKIIKGLSPNGLNVNAADMNNDGHITLDDVRRLGNKLIKY